MRSALSFIPVHSTAHEKPAIDGYRGGRGAANNDQIVPWYNFGRKHEALKGNTPAMASGLSDHVWTIRELIERAGGI
jgi:hypothetical protein